jgi:osmotically-inducible protein OsmY
MKPFVATLLATALTAAFSSAYAHDGKPDTATYRTMTQKAAADYKIAAAKCTGMTGNERAVCVEEAKVTRARADIDAVAQYNNTTKARATARTALANAEHALARVKCSVMSGAEKDSCISNAKSVHTAALADAKADRDIRVATNTAVDGKGLIANTQTSEPAKAAAVDKCAQIAGQPSTGCLIDNKDNTVSTPTPTTTAGVLANRTENAAANAAANTRSAAATVAQKTENAAETAVEKTKQVASNIADKTERAVDRVAGRTDVAADKTERVADNAAAKTGKVVSDSVITTKVKADLFKEPELSAMAIHVETEKGVVMLSGFVDSKADAEKAVRLAKSVEGVTQVKSAIKVK